jgi:hypothetical protein
VEALRIAGAQPETASGEATVIAGLTTLRRALAGEGTPCAT